MKQTFFYIELSHTIAFRLKGHRSTIHCTEASTEVAIPVVTLSSDEDKFPVVREFDATFTVMPGVRTRKQFINAPVKPEICSRPDLREKYGDMVHSSYFTVSKKLHCEVRRYKGRDYRRVYHHFGSDWISEFPAVCNEYIENILDCTSGAMWVSHPDKWKRLYNPGAIPGDATIVTGHGYELQDAIAHTMKFAEDFLIFENNGKKELWKRFDEKEPWRGIVKD